MQGVLLGIAASLLGGAAVAQGCAPAVGPAEVRLAGDAAAPSALILVPPGWAPGDPALVLHGGDAFRAGCTDGRVAAMLGAGMLVLAMDAQGEPSRDRLAGAFMVLRDGVGAGGVGALWSAALPGQCEALLAPLSPPGFAVRRACRRSALG
jgi:hypothetical protein